MFSLKCLALPIALIVGVTVTAQSSTTYRARLSPVALDVAMQVTVSGSGSVSALLTGTKLTISGTFDGLKSAATIAQIHKGPIKGVRGPAVFDLTVSSGMNGTITGTVTLTSVQVTDLEKGRLYVQLHSEKAPDGNLWGWLLLPEQKR
jgi:hypothetical protein